MRVPTASVIGRENITKKVKKDFFKKFKKSPLHTKHREGTKLCVRAVANVASTPLTKLEIRFYAPNLGLYEWRQYLRRLKAFFYGAKQEVEIILQGISHMIGTVPGLALITTPGGSSSARACVDVSHSFSRTITFHYSVHASFFYFFHLIYFLLFLFQVSFFT